MGIIDRSGVLLGREMSKDRLEFLLYEDSSKIIASPKQSQNIKTLKIKKAESDKEDQHMEENFNKPKGETAKITQAE